MEKLKNKINIFCLALLIAFSFSLSISNSGYASECGDNCRATYPNDADAEKDCEDTCKDLEKQADKLKDQIDVKNKQANTLSNQLDYINNQQNINQRNLNSTIKNINDLSEKINTLEKDIKEKEKEIAYQKKILSVLMQSYYDYNQQGVLGLILFNEAVASPFEKTDYIEQSGMKASELLENIKESQNKLISDQEELKKSQEESVALKSKLQDEKYDLQLTENQKQSLLNQTQGDQAKYEDLLARVEQQKLELFNFSSASNLGEVSNSVSSYPSPPSKYRAPTSWYFSQKDSRWGSQRIGNSKSLMKDYGCAVTSVAMVFRKNGSSTDPGKLAKEKIFSYDLINWPSSWSPGIDRVSSISHGNVNWSTIDNYISKGDPVIVYIKKTNGRGGHYVVITGYDKKEKDYVVHDPYFGPNLYLGTSRSLVGKIGTNSGTSIDQMIIYK